MSLARLLAAGRNSCSRQMCPSAVAVPAQLCCSSHTALGRRLCLALPGFGGSKGEITGKGDGIMARGRARRLLPGCPSLPARPARGVTSSRGFCPALLELGFSRHPWVGFGNSRKLCQCHAGLTAPAPGVTGGNWAVTSESSHGWGSPRSGVGAFLCAQEAEQEPHLKK